MHIDYAEAIGNISLHLFSSGFTFARLDYNVDRFFLGIMTS